MKTSITAAAMIAFAASSAAFADTTVDIEFTFERSELVDAASAEKTLAKFEAKAEEACSYRQSLTGQLRVDNDCVDEAVSKAVREVGSDALTAAYTESQSNLRVARVG